MRPVSSQPFVSPGSSDEPGVRPAGINQSGLTNPENGPEKNAGKLDTSVSSHSPEPRLRQRENGTSIDSGQTAGSLPGRLVSDAAGNPDGADTAASGGELKPTFGHALHGATEPAFKMSDGHLKSFAVETVENSTVELPRDIYARILETMPRSLDKTQLGVEAYTAERLNMLESLSLVNNCFKEIARALLASPEFADARQIQCSRQLEKVLRSADSDDERMAQIRIICNSHPVISLQLSGNVSPDGHDDPFGNHQMDEASYSKQADLLFKSVFSSEPEKKIDLVLGSRIGSPANVINSLLRQAQLLKKNNPRPVVELWVETDKEFVSKIDWTTLRKTIDLKTLIFQGTQVNWSNFSYLLHLFKKNEVLECLGFANTGLSDSDTRSIINAVRTGATKLDSFYCRAEKAYSPSIEKLGEWLGSNPALKKVDVRTVRVDVDAVGGLFDSLATNKNLNHLMIGPCTLTDQVIDKLDKSMAVRSVPLTLTLHQYREESLSGLSSDSLQKLHDLGFKGLRVSWRQD
jgi:hypothetical protein